MADTIGFNEGKDFLLQQLRGASGITVVHFLLSTKDTGTLVATDTLGGGVGEITGWTGGATPYARISQTVPAPSSGVISFSQIAWATDTSTNGPASVKSVVMVANAANKALFAWNINAGGSAVAMNAASTTLQFTPTFFLQNVGGG
jgi:hypothetical protein